MQLSDLWLYFLVIFALGFAVGWIRRWPIQS